MDRVHRWNTSAFLRSNSFGTLRHHQDVTMLSFTDCSPFICCHFTIIQGNKKPCSLCSKQGVEIFFRYVYLLTSSLSIFVSRVDPPYDLDSPRLNTQPWINRL